MSQLYLQAAAMVDETIQNGRTLRSSFDRRKGSDTVKAEYLLAAESLKFRKVMKDIFADCGVVDIDSLEVRESVALVMCFELLFGRGVIVGGGQVKRVLTSMAEQLRSALSRRMEGKGSFQELLGDNIQQYNNLATFVRVNTLKVSCKEAMIYLKQRVPEDCSLAMDEYIPSLIAIPATGIISNLGNDPWVLEGKLVIQDKASCFPSQVLADCWDGGNMIDSCAAPGNKTSHLAALLFEKTSDGVVDCPPAETNPDSSQGNMIFAFDKDSRRARVLQDRMNLMGASHLVSCRNSDFLQVDISTAPYAAVSGILLDPSCSGSGVVRSFERVIERSSDGEVNTARVEKLKRFQIKALVKALSFPSAKVVVYSTCSIHAAENEEVVASVLREIRSDDSEKTAAQWQLSAPSRFCSWPRRGVPIDGLTEEESACLIRCSPEDGTNGFFVALFRRSLKNVTPATPVLSKPVTYTERSSIVAASETSDSAKDTPVEQKIKRKAVRENSGFLGAKRFKVSRSATRKFKHKKI